MARGDVTALGDWTPGAGHEALQKLCHDLLAWQVGAAPRYFARRRPAQAAAVGRAHPLVARAGQGGTHGRPSLQCRPDAGGACRPGAKHPTLQTTNALTMSSPIHSAPSQRHAAGHQGKGRLVRGLHSFFCRRRHFCPHPRDYKLGDDVYVLLTLPDDTQRYPVAGRVAWVTPRRGRQPHPGGGHPVSQRRKIAPAQAQDRGNPGHCPGLGASYADHLMAPLRPVPTRAGGSAFLF
jgi:hypothetical protein